MDEKLINDQNNISDIEKVNKIKTYITNLKEKKNKFLFVVPETENPTASVYEVYFHATTLKNLGYEVIILTEKPDYEKPVWVDSELLDHKFVPITENKLSVGPEDVMIIPDVFSNVMEQTKKLPCVRIGLLQSVDYMLNALIPGSDWKSFGIKDVITTSNTLKDFMNTFYGKDKYNVNVYNPSIPDYFKRTDEPQKPIISVVGRNPNEISKIVKLFFSRFPQYKWVTFDPMLTKSKPPKPMRRKDFAERLRGNFAAIWVDRISSWGTFPLECMKSGVIPIGLLPDIIPEYLIDKENNKLKDDTGMWTNNLYDIPVLTGELLIKFLNDELDDKIYENMENVSSEYSIEKSQNQLKEIYENIISNRIKILEDSIESLTDKSQK